MKKINILLFGNGSSENHGCEAIAITCIELLKEVYDKIYIGTLNKSVDKSIKNMDDVELLEYHYEGQQDLINKFKRKILKINTNYWFDNIEQVLDDITLAISVGGDNYCYSNNEWLYKLQDILEKKDIPTVLLGCSVNEIDSTMERYFNKYNLILSRETLSCKMISSFHKNVKLLPDPAFSLKIVEDSFYFNSEKKYIGINLSPLIMEYEETAGLAYRNFEQLIAYILNETDKDILLVPHVVFKNKYGDIEILKKFEEQFNSPRIRIAYSHDCRVLKYYISKCEILVAARTHASIAAYSTNVPCIVLGYSNKSLGIANDLFNSTKDFVVSVKELESENDILNAYFNIMNNYVDVVNILKKKNEEFSKLLPLYGNYIYEFITQN